MKWNEKECSCYVKCPLVIISEEKWTFQVSGFKVADRFLGFVFCVVPISTREVRRNFIFCLLRRLKWVEVKIYGMTRIKVFCFNLLRITFTGTFWWNDYGRSRIVSGLSLSFFRSGFQNLGDLKSFRGSRKRSRQDLSLVAEFWFELVTKYPIKNQSIKWLGKTKIQIIGLSKIK
jgi:hypothetical protein